MGSFFVVVGPVRGENLVGLAAEQEVECLKTSRSALPFSSPSLMFVFIYENSLDRHD
jgi:hypothetical protein